MHEWVINDHNIEVLDFRFVMNCNSFYAKTRPGKVRIDVSQGVYHQESNNYVDIPDDDSSDISEFSDEEELENNLQVSFLMCKPSKLL